MTTGLGGTGADCGKGDESTSAQSAGEKGVDAGTDYQALLAERDTKIAALEDETADAAEKLRAEMNELRCQGNKQHVSFELTMAGAKNVKAARALLPD